MSVAPVKPKVRIGRRYRPERVKDRYDVVVIGSGPGGLAAASTLAKFGRSVAVFERHYTIGGGAHSYERAGYRWDIGLHFINDMITPGSPSAAVGDYVSGGRMRWTPMSNEFVYSAGQAEYRIPFLAGERTRDWFCETFPDERENFLQFQEDVRALSRKAGIGLGLQKLAGPGLIGDLLRAVAKAVTPAEAVRSAEEKLGEYFDDKNLIACIASIWVAFGVPPRELPFFALSALSVIDNQLCYPDGGGAMIGQGLYDEITAHGGEVFAYADVLRIDVDKGRACGVTLADGTRVEAGAVISDAGARNTFTRLLPDAVADKSGYLAKMEEVAPSLCHLNLFVGIRATAEELGLTPGEHIVDASLDLNEGLAAFAENVADAKIPNVFFAFPSMKDPSFAKAYPGRTTATMIAYVDAWHAFRQWEDTAWGARGADYDALKERLSAKMLGLLYHRFPQLEGRVDFYELSTPLTMRHFANAPRGEALGAAFNADRFGPAAWLSRKTKIKGLYLTGQDTLAMGFTPALMSGVLTASSLLKWREKRRLFRELKAQGRTPSPSAISS